MPFPAAPGPRGAFCLAIAAWCLPAQADFAVLSATSLTNVQSVDSSNRLSSDIDPGEWATQSSAGSSFASIMVDAGVGRSFTATLPADGGTRTASTGLEWYITLKNLSDAAVTLQAGAFRAEWDFTLAKVESTQASARFTATANGTFSVAGQGPSVAYRHIDETGAAAPFILGSGLRNGSGTFEVLAATETRFHARAESGEVHFEPGAEGRVMATLVTSVVAGPGWAAAVDATRSVRVFITLPQGVGIESPVPLAFVTTVPEPAPLALLLAGLGMGAVLRARQGRRRGLPFAALRSTP